VTAPQFKLLWRDEFDDFDTGRWQKANHDFPENAAQFTPDNAVVEGGFLKLRISNTPNNGHAYSAAEVYTNDTFTFGRFEARIRFAPGSGIVSSLFTYRDDANHGWNEIDIENLGYITDGVQYNLISSPLGGGALTYQPKVVQTGFPPTADFHDYAIEWTPVDIRFYVDEKLAWRDVQTRINQASRLRMNIWPTNNAKTTFAGPLDASKIPAEANTIGSPCTRTNPELTLLATPSLHLGSAPFRAQARGKGDSRTPGNNTEPPTRTTDHGFRTRRDLQRTDRTGARCLKAKRERPSARVAATFS